MIFFIIKRCFSLVLHSQTRNLCARARVFQVEAYRNFDIVSHWLIEKNQYISGVKESRSAKSYERESGENETSGELSLDVATQRQRKIMGILNSNRKHINVRYKYNKVFRFGGTVAFRSPI